MPPRSTLLTKHWPTVELPILPFLAPRVFTPWPSTGRRAHTAAQQIQKSHGTEDNYDISDQMSPEEQRRRIQRGLSHPGWSVTDDNAPKLPPIEPPDERRMTSEGAYRGARSVFRPSLGSVRKPAEASSWTSVDEDFQRKYDTIWGAIEQMSSFDIARIRPENMQTIKPLSANGEINKYCGPRVLRSDTFSEAGDRFILRQNKRLHRSPPARPDQDPRRWKRAYKSPGPVLDRLLACKKRVPLPTHQSKVVNDRVLSEAAVSEKEKTDPTLGTTLMESVSSASLRQNWEGLSPDEQRDLWSELMLSTLHKYPTKALKFLAATYVHPYPPGFAVCDSFDNIVSYYLGDQKAKNPKNALQIFEVLNQMIRRGPRLHFLLRQSTLYLLINHLDDDVVRRLFQLLTEYDHPLSSHTLMQFASKLRLSGGADERMELLRRLWRQKSDFNSPQMIGVCVSLLQLKGRVSEIAYSDSEIFEFMLKCGLLPNIVIYNVLLQNSLESEDHNTGWKIHDMMLENGIDTDAYTYSLLLSDAKLRNDQPSIERIINIVSEKDIRNAHVVTDLLHAIFLHYGDGASSSWEKRENGRHSETFERMLLVYCQYFRLEPLQRLIPWLEDSYPNNTPVSNKRLMDVNLSALVVMVTALLRQISEPGPVVRFYNHFCSLVQAKDPVATELSKSSRIYNIILKALGEFQETLELCPRIIGDMLFHNIPARSETRGTSQDASTAQSQISVRLYKPLHDDLQSRNAPAQDHKMSKTPPGFISTQRSDAARARPTSVTTSTTRRRRLYPNPNIHTWSIMLKAFMAHGQPRAAEKVLTMMKERGVAPNQVTWNTLIIGYARMQDMTMTIDSVKRLKKAEFDLDEFTTAGLAYFQNRRGLIDAMKALESSHSGWSLGKESAKIGSARTPPNNTVKIVQDDLEGDNLESVEDVVGEMRGTKDRVHERILWTPHNEKEELSVVKDVQRL